LLPARKEAALRPRKPRRRVHAGHFPALRKWACRDVIIAGAVGNLIFRSGIEQGRGVINWGIDEAVVACGSRPEVTSRVSGLIGTLGFFVIRVVDLFRTVIVRNSGTETYTSA
jgi:hypothetical protein